MMHPLLQSALAQAANRSAREPETVITIWELSCPPFAFYVRNEAEGRPTHTPSCGAGEYRPLNAMEEKHLNRHSDWKGGKRI